MKTFGANGRSRAFTLVEMLCVMAILALLLMLLLPALSSARARARRVECVSQLRQAGVAFHAFAHDHNGHFPMRLPAGAGGTAESAMAARRVAGELASASVHFQVLSNDLVTPRLLLCPADERRPAITFSTMRDANVSYFIGLNADYAFPNSLLAGDRNLTNDWAGPTNAPARVGGNFTLRWTYELHRFKGNLLFSDGHVEEKGGPMLLASLNQVPPVAELTLPAAPPVLAVPTRSGAVLPSPPAPSGTRPGTLGGNNTEKQQPLRLGEVAPPARTDLGPAPAQAPVSPKGTNPAVARKSPEFLVTPGGLQPEAKSPVVAEPTMKPSPIVGLLTGPVAAAGYVLFLVLLLALLLQRLWASRSHFKRESHQDENES